MPARPGDTRILPFSYLLPPQIRPEISDFLVASRLQGEGHRQSFYHEAQALQVRLLPQQASAQGLAPCAGRILPRQDSGSIVGPGRVVTGAGQKWVVMPP